MADKMRIEETLTVHGSMLIRLEAAAIRNERSFAEIRATLDRLVDRLEVLNTHLANQDITTINRSNTDGGNDDSNRSGEAETLKANVKDERGINDLLRLRTLAGGNIVKTQYDQDSLIRRIEKPLGFSKGRPTAACIIYKCLCHWRSFEDEKTSIFDRIIQAINHNIETQDDNSVLAYWLSTASTLLALTRQQLEPKYPAVLFKQQLTAYVKKIYGMIRDNLKKEISPLLGLCIQAPRIYRANFLKGNAAALTSAASQDILIAHWQEIVNNIGRFLNVLKSNNVPPLLVRKIFAQIFSFINVQLFNSLLLRRECCSFSNAEYVKAGLSELEQWCYNATEEYAGSAWDELKHIRQAIGFMLINQKQNKTLDDISHDFCPVLSIQQLYRISTMYYDDKHYTHSLSPEVISEMRVLMTEDSNNAVSSSFLLDDDTSIPLSVDDLCKSMDQMIDKTDIGLPPSVLDRLGLSFLSSRVG